MSIKKKTEKSLLKTVIKKGVPKALRAHAYLVFFGGFHHLPGQRYEGQINFEQICEDAEYDEREEETEENLLIMDQIDKDMVRTHFPQEKKIRKFEKLWGVNLRNKKDPAWVDFRSEEVNVPVEIKKAVEEMRYLDKATKKVLFVYSKVDKEVGYVQGMNSIAAAIAYNVWVSQKEFEKFKRFSSVDSIFGEDHSQNHTQKGLKFEPFEHLAFELNYSEKEMFFIFYGVMKYCNQRRFFLPKMSDLQTRIEDFEIYLSHELPLVHERMCGSAQVRKTLITLDPIDCLCSFILFDYLFAFMPTKILRKSDRYIHAFGV